MKKHIIAILILTLVLALVGVGIWFIVKHNNSQPLYKANSNFIISEDTNTLIARMKQAEDLYQSKAVSNETRLTTLQTIIGKLDEFEKDLNSYLQLSTAKTSTTNKLSKTHKNLTSERIVLITDYNEYITRMSGNTNISGTAIKDLYNDIFNKTVNYLYDYNSCFKSTSNYVFSKVYKVDTIKDELYTLYSVGVSNLLNNISSNQFSSTTTINHLNKGIKLIDDNLYIKSTVIGGEFSVEALNFKKYFNDCDLDTLIANFENYYDESINLNTETSNEKLAIYYAKLILEI